MTCFSNMEFLSTSLATAYRVYSHSFDAPCPLPRAQNSNKNYEKILLSETGPALSSSQKCCRNPLKRAPQAKLFSISGPRGREQARLKGPNDQVKVKFTLEEVMTHPSGRAVKGVGLQPLACCNCGFKSPRVHECLCVGLITRPEESYHVWCV